MKYLDTYKLFTEGKFTLNRYPYPPDQDPISDVKSDCEDILSEIEDIGFLTKVERGLPLNPTHVDITIGKYAKFEFDDILDVVARLTDYLGQNGFKPEKDESNFRFLMGGMNKPGQILSIPVFDEEFEINPNREMWMTILKYTK